MEVLKTVGVAFGINYGTHVLSSTVYNYFCVPHSLSDVLNSLVTIASPVCSTALGVMQVTQTNYASILTTTLATTIASSLR